MTREASHVTEFPSQVLMDLAKSRPFRTKTKDGHFHVCFEKKLKQSAFNNFLLNHTPYRCSLLGEAITSEKMKRRAKRANKACITTESGSSTSVSLPKITQNFESFISSNDAPGSNTRQTVQEQGTTDLIDRENDAQNPSCAFLSCGAIAIDDSLQTAVPPSHTANRDSSRSRTLPLILNRQNSSCYLRRNVSKFKSLSKLPEKEHRFSKRMESVYSYRPKQSPNDEYTTIMEDGAKVTVKQRRLFIEVFMPRTS